MCLKLRLGEGAKRVEGEIAGGDSVKSLEGPVWEGSSMWTLKLARTWTGAVLERGVSGRALWESADDWSTVVGEIVTAGAAKQVRAVAGADRAMASIENQLNSPLFLT